MNLFKNRPLAVICFIFLAAGAALYRTDLALRAAVAVALAAAFLAALIFTLIAKGDRVKKIFVTLCLFAALLAPMSQILGMDIPRSRALNEVGEQRVLFTVESVEYSSDYSAEYGVKISEIEGEKLGAPSVAVTGFGSRLEIGDRVFAKASIYPAGENIFGYSRNSEDNVYIHLAIYEESDYIILERGKLTFRGAFNILRGRVADYMDASLGESTSALCRGFLLGDKSELGNDVIRDFRRSGVSHLLSVSGLHVSVILGAIGFLLMKLSAPKKLRCVILSLFALFFLGMTGFSMSASRSVIMTLSVYFTYLLVKESDSVTALFVSVAVIVMVFPHAARDVGLALSFLATLGILTAYVPVTNFLHRRRKSGVGGTVRYLLERAFFTVILTFICNSFICIVVWVVFGEMSAVGLLSNSIISPAAGVLIIMAPIACILGGIPLIGDGAALIVEIFGDIIVFLAGSFSRIHGAVISLRYPFAGVIICFMSAALVVMLVIELKRKWMIIFPPLAAILIFAICLFGYGVIHSGETKMTYKSVLENEMIVFTKGYSAAVCDISSGSHSFLEGASKVVSDNMATEISEYLVTHYHKRHIPTLEKLFRETLLHSIYLPEPRSAEEREIMASILDSSEKYGVEAIVYSEGERLDLLGGWAAVVFDDNDRHRAASAVFCFGEDLTLYVGAGENGESLPTGAFYDSSYIIFGKHGDGTKVAFGYDLSSSGLKRAFFADREAAMASDIEFGEAEVFAFERRSSYDFEIILE